MNNFLHPVINILGEDLREGATTTDDGSCTKLLFMHFIDTIKSSHLVKGRVQECPIKISSTMVIWDGAMVFSV